MRITCSQLESSRKKGRARFSIKRSQDLGSEGTVEESTRYRSLERNHLGGQGMKEAVATKTDEIKHQCKQYCYCTGAI